MVCSFLQVRKQAEEPQGSMVVTQETAHWDSSLSQCPHMGQSDQAQLPTASFVPSWISIQHVYLCFTMKLATCWAQS